PRHPLSFPTRRSSDLTKQRASKNFHFTETPLHSTRTTTRNLFLFRLFNLRLHHQHHSHLRQFTSLLSMFLPKKLQISINMRRIRDRKSTRLNSSHGSI